MVPFGSDVSSHPMKIVPISEAFCQNSPVWFRRCSVATLVISIGLLCLSLLAYAYHSLSVTTPVPLLLIALSFAAFLNIYSLWFFRNEHRRSDQAFRNTDCEFASIFRHDLEGIVIADSAGNALDANPAAAAILRCPRNELIGHNICRFVENANAFDQGW